MVGSGKQNLHHFMVEMCSLDDVGQGYDLAVLEEGRVAYTLGRHTNDYMTSFYSHSPSGFFVEYGWGGRVIAGDVDHRYSRLWDIDEYGGHFSMAAQSRTRLPCCHFPG
jgi:hypothetical protein